MSDEEYLNKIIEKMISLKYIKKGTEQFFGGSDCYYFTDIGKNYLNHNLNSPSYVAFVKSKNCVWASNCLSKNRYSPCGTWYNPAMKKYREALDWVNKVFNLGITEDDCQDIDINDILL